MENILKHTLAVAWQKRLSMNLPSNAFRFLNGGADGIDGLIVDIYGSAATMHLYKPVAKSTIELVCEWLVQEHNISFINLKDRTSPASNTIQQMEVLYGQDSIRMVQENGISFSVDLQDTLNPGLFLDMRKNRWLTSAHLQGKSVLNLFAYTCSFGLYARKFGAFHVVNVDLSGRYLQKGKHNYELNGVEVNPGEFCKMDSFAYLDYACKKGLKFDHIILDPPSFSKGSKKLKGPFRIERDLPFLLQQVLGLIGEGGSLVVSTNCSRLSLDDLYMELKNTKRSMGIHYKTTQSLGQDADFTGSGNSTHSHLAGLWVQNITAQF
jgi:23S rRNA (cytosine1962-C5)-methyltransferase